MRQIHRVLDLTQRGNQAPSLRDNPSPSTVGQPEGLEQMLKLCEMHLTGLAMPSGQKSNSRLVHMLLEPGYKETVTVCGIRVPAVWDDIGLDAEEIVEFGDDWALVTCEFCRAKSGKVRGADSRCVKPVRFPPRPVTATTGRSN